MNVSNSSSLLPEDRLVEAGCGENYGSIVRDVEARGCEERTLIEHVTWKPGNERGKGRREGTSTISRTSDNRHVGDTARQNELSRMSGQEYAVRVRDPGIQSDGAL